MTAGTGAIIVYPNSFYRAIVIKTSVDEIALNNNIGEPDQRPWATCPTASLNSQIEVSMSVLNNICPTRPHSSV